MMRGTATALAAIASAAIVLAPAPANAGKPAKHAKGKIAFTWLPGAARSIPRTDSASRDTPVMEYAYGPRAMTTIGLEWAWFMVSWKAASLRFGMYAMLPLENHDFRAFFPPSQLWRGMSGLSLALSMDEAARWWLGADGAFEVSAVLGHESDHGWLRDDVSRPDDIPEGGGGDFVTVDVALRLPLAHGRLLIVLRAHSRMYLRGALKAAPGGDLILKWKQAAHLVPILAAFAEAILPSSEAAADGYFVRVMAGVAIPGRIGEFTLFGSIDAGNGKGLLVNHKEFRMSLGIRYSPLEP